MRLQTKLMYRSPNIGGLGLSLAETESMRIDEALDWVRLLAKEQRREAAAVRDAFDGKGAS